MLPLISKIPGFVGIKQTRRWEQFLLITARIPAPKARPFDSGPWLTFRTL